MEKIPCIKYNPNTWDYIVKQLESFGYKRYWISSWENCPYIILNLGGQLGEYSNVVSNCTLDYNREIVNSTEEFLERAAKLMNKTYKRKDIMEINGIEIKPGMVITTEDDINYIAFPTAKGIAFVNNHDGGWSSTIPEDIIAINDIAENTYLDSGKLLWERPEEIVLTMDEIAKKFGCSIKQLRIKK